MTDSIGHALFDVIAKNSNIPTNSFILRNDSGGGSTIGPMMAANTGIKTIDFGVGIIAMHSARELGGIIDMYYLRVMFIEFFKQYSKINHIELFKN